MSTIYIIYTPKEKKSSLLSTPHILYTVTIVLTDIKVVISEARNLNNLEIFKDQERLYDEYYTNQLKLLKSNQMGYDLYLLQKKTLNNIHR